MTHKQIGHEIGRWIRYISTACLLFVVWRHSHWSVALTLTGLCIANEIATSKSNP